VTLGTRRTASASHPRLRVRKEETSCAALSSSAFRAGVVVGLRELDRSTGALLRFAAGAAEARKTSVRVLHAWNVLPEVHHHGNALRVVDEDGPTADGEKEAPAATVGAWQNGLPLRIVRQIAQGARARL
jgi:hypothetical protein